MGTYSASAIAASSKVVMVKSGAREKRVQTELGEGVGEVPGLLVGSGDEVTSWECARSSMWDA